MYTTNLRRLHRIVTDEGRRILVEPRDVQTGGVAALEALENIADCGVPLLDSEIKCGLAVTVAKCGVGAVFEQ